VEFDVPQTESEVAKPMNAGEMGFTTVMIREIPSRYTQRNVSDEVSAVNANFDFLYMPPARKDGGSKGYAFVNFMDEESAARFIAEFQGHTFTKQPSSIKKALVGYAEVQGLERNLKFYRRCKAMKSTFVPYVNKDVLKAQKAVKKAKKASA
jgi:RNA recognition motif-containing protein